MTRPARVLPPAAAAVWVFAAAVVPVLAPPAAAGGPNVVLIVTDDQGYGDLSCHGNPVLKTPEMDRLHAESVRLTDYHVDPTCSPTRAALYTGRYSTRTGVWHTIQGRSLMHPDETTLAERLRDAGYRTGMIGKWHLGDNAPLRARDQGFDFTFVHGGGGVGQSPDHWGNDYFGDTYTRFSRDEADSAGTAELVTVDGYCTDEWFAAADRFVSRSAGDDADDRPFFLTLATNAPHGPYLVGPEWSAPYREAGVTGDRANFYGMIACIDARLGEFRARLADLGLADDTIFLFTTDNGTAAGHRDGGFNAGMRGAKGSEYDGGHRVPMFVHWPAGGLTGGRDVARLTAHVDVLPTVLSLCGLPAAADADRPLDGRDLSPLLRGEGAYADWPDRTLCVHSQRIEVPEQWRKAAVMTDRWRLINGQQLFDVRADPGQTADVSAGHPAVVADLRAAYEAWWESLSPAFDEPMTADAVRIRLSDEPTELCAHDWHEPTKGLPPWNQTMIRKDPSVNGWWAVEVSEAGTYRFTLRDRPAAAGEDAAWTGEARLRLDAEGRGGSRRTESGRSGAFSSPPTFDQRLQPGRYRLHTSLTEGDVTRGAYYVQVERLDQ